MVYFEYGEYTMPNFREYNQSQMNFMPIIPSDLLEEEHSSRIIDKVVELLNIDNIIETYKEEGNPPYNPRMMLKVLFYAYYIGAMSCRKIWDNLKFRADFIFLSGCQIPDFRTINDFRKRHIELLPDLFSQIVHLCSQLEMIDFKYLAIDGQKIKANANFTKSKNKERLEKSLERVKNGLAKLIEKEINEDFPEEVKKKREKKLKIQKKHLEELQIELEKRNEEKATINLTDKDAVVMKHKDGRSMPSYNHVSAVDGKYGITVAVDTKDDLDCPDDLFSLVEKSKENTGENEIENVVADPAFADYSTLEKMETMAENFLIPDTRFAITESGESCKGKYDKSNFTIDENGELICPEGKELHLKGTTKFDDGHSLRVFECLCGKDCINHSKCSKAEKRTVSIDSREKFREKMREKLRSDKGREIYMKRQGIVESGHGNDQKNKGWTQHNLRGLAKATLEFILVRIGSNLGKIVKYKGKELLAM